MLFETTFGSEWRERAECIGYDPDVFVTTERDWTPNKALEICSRCSVTEECLDYAIETHQRIGVWGGKTATQRERVAKLRRTKRGPS